MYSSKEEKMVYIIKMIGQATVLNTFREHLIKSQKDGEPKAYYNITEKTSKADREIFDQMKLETSYSCALLDYTNEDITCLYWAKCEKYISDPYKAMHCKLLYKTENKSIIDNFIYSLQLDLVKDFPEESFINYEISIPLLEQMRKFEKMPYQCETSLLEYPIIKEEETLSNLAQRNHYCRRKYNLRKPKDRGEFQRDYDRIIYSKAYRRMVDKAQIFSSVKGDHYRTRMTHTLIVCQIARSLSSLLGLNSTLAEAIGAGHDLGHTPFGHQGERTLHSILTGKHGFEVNNLAVKINDEKPEYPYGGFKHNYQSVRVATFLESQYLEIDGLDLSEQTLNGMWMHTEKKTGINIRDFSDKFLSDEGNFAFTLEGQVVAVADEIAQRSHDIDDAFASHLITLSDFTEYLELKKFTQLREKIDNVSKKLEELKEINRLFVDENETIRAQISTIIVNHFIQDVCNATKPKMDGYNVIRFNADNHRVKEKLVSFSDEGESLCKYLDNLIRKKVINSHEVTLFDQNGSNVVLALFKAYYNNPMLLHNGTLKRIWNEYRKNNLETVDFKEGKPEIVKDEWDKITTTSISTNPDKRTNEQEEVLQKRIILVQSICDFISGMTDSYALNEYRRIIS
jgi:deoxyguanosinetriphosphate triphosphohydrolase, putative